MPCLARRKWQKAFDGKEGKRTTSNPDRTPLPQRDLCARVLGRTSIHSSTPPSNNAIGSSDCLPSHQLSILTALALLAVLLARHPTLPLIKLPSLAFGTENICPPAINALRPCVGGLIVHASERSCDLKVRFACLLSL